MSTHLRTGAYACAFLIVSACSPMPHEHAAHLNSEEPLALPTFEQSMAEAMARMDKGMDIAHTGDPDRDFAAMMIPHHQGAVDMAKAELQHGRNPVLRRLAEGIIIEQQQEIELMRRELRRLPAPAQSKNH